MAFNSHLTQVTVATNKRLAVTVNGVVTVYLGGDTVYLPNYRIPVLRLQGLIN